MKLHTETTPVEYSDGIVQQNFTIKATGKAFQILSSGLYSNKILAIVRELSCNAYDSHVAAGKSDTPITIKLPSSIDPTFYVQDFGTGLSNEQVLKLYTTYFDSTKQDSNDFIGALGLGSKSPFSYTDNFTVESRYNGVKYLYSCFLDENQLPSIACMGSEETDESNGMTVMLAVKRDDIYKFTEAAKKALMYFNPKPTILGHHNFETYDLEHTVKGSNWKIRKSDYYAYMNGPYVVQGFVAYPIDRTIMKEQEISNTAKVLADASIDFSVPIGQVEVAASREALSYDKRTTENLVQVFEQAALEIRESFQQSFDNCKTAWEMGILYDELSNSESYEFRNLFDSLNTEKPFTWNNEPVSDKLIIDLTGINKTQLGVMFTVNAGTKLCNSKKWSPRGNGNTYDVSIHKCTHILVDTEATGNSEIYRRYLNTVPTTDRRTTKLLVIRPISKKLYSQFEIDNIIRMLGASEFKYVADLGITIDKKTKTTYTKRDKAERLLWSGFTISSGRNPKKYDKYSRHTWTSRTIDLSTGGFYVPISRFTPIHDTINTNDLDSLISSAKSLGIFPEKYTPVYGFKQTEIDDLPDDADWIDLFEYVKLKFEKLDADGKLSGRTIVENVYKETNQNFVKFTIQQWERADHLILDGDFKNFMDKLYKLNKDSHNYSASTVSSLARTLNVKLHSDTKTHEFITEWKKLLKKYEMLSLLGYVYNEDVHKWHNYINLVERSLVIPQDLEYNED